VTNFENSVSCLLVGEGNPAGDLRFVGVVESSSFRGVGLAVTFLFCVVDQLGSDPWEADPCYSLGTFPLLEAVNNHEEVPSGDP